MPRRGPEGQELGPGQARSQGVKHRLQGEREGVPPHTGHCPTLQRKQ